MKPSHPPTLLKLAERTAREANLFRPGDTVLVAVSGGPDSMALLSVMARLAGPFGLTLLAHGVDHGLRPEAEAELALAGRLAEDLGVPFDVTRIQIERGPNLMARARAGRYDALRAALGARSPADRGGARLIATGHHADDRAETVLIRLLRGAGPPGLAVLPPRSGDRIRPLIRARRRDILAHLQRHAINYAEDPSNRDPHFLRSRVRHEVLPLLTELSPKVVEHLCGIADALLDPAEVPSQIDGTPLGRAQRLSLTRALRTRNSRIRVPIAGGRVAHLDLSTGRIVLMKEE